MVAGQSGRGEPSYGFTFGTGVVYGFLAEYYAGGEPSPLVAAKTLARGVGSTLVQGEMIRRMARPFRGSVELEGGRSGRRGDYLAVAAGTIDHIGLNFRPFNRYAERDESFHALGIYASPLQFVGELPRIWRAESMRAADVRVVQHANGGPKRRRDDALHDRRRPPHHGGEIEVSIGPRVKIVVGS